MIRWLVHRWMPAAAAKGSRGLPTPDPVDIAAVARARGGKAVLAAPAGHEPAPALVTGETNLSAPALYDAMLRAALSGPRCFLAAAYPTRLQAHVVVRTERLDIPEMVVLQAVETGEATSAAVMLSVGVYACPGSGARRRLLAIWLAALEQEIKTEERQ